MIVGSVMFILLGVGTLMLVRGADYNDPKEDEEQEQYLKKWSECHRKDHK